MPLPFKGLNIPAKTVVAMHAC